MTADQFADWVCGNITATCGAKPNEVFRLECRALGRLVERGEMKQAVAEEAMLGRFVRSVMGKDGLDA